MVRDGGYRWSKLKQSFLVHIAFVLSENIELATAYERPSDRLLSVILHIPLALAF